MKISTKCEEFWNSQVNDGCLYALYGAGRISERILDLVNQTDLRIDFIIDSDISKNGHYFNGLKIYSPEMTVQTFKNKKIKVFIANQWVESTLSRVAGIFDSMEVYIPPFENKYPSFNFAIAPLRQKIIKNTNFTIISNTCSGTRMYQVLNCEYQSPLISLIIKPKEYLKLCKNLKYYMSQDLEFVRNEEWMISGKYHALCKLDDVEMKFIGRTNFDEINERWQERLKRVNYDNIIFIWDSTHYKPTQDIYKEFLQIPYGKKLIFQGEGFIPVENSIFVTERQNIFTPDNLLEHWFDITNFINK